MIIPVRCFTCGKVLADKYLWYIKEVRKIKISKGMDIDEVIYLDDKFKDNCSKRVRQLLGFNYPYPKIMDTSKSVNQIGIGYKANK